MCRTNLSQICGKFLNKFVCLRFRPFLSLFILFLSFFIYLFIFDVVICFFHFREQRTNYYKHRFKAKETPEKLMTVIIDGMDQAKLMLPMILKLSKAFSDAVKLKTHLTGCLDHGRAPYVIIDFFTWKHDSNHTINCLLKVLERRNFIPDILYLHLDNTPRENKNQYVFTFLALLVASKIFKKVYQFS